MILSNGMTQKYVGEVYEGNDTFFPMGYGIVTNDSFHTKAMYFGAICSDEYTKIDTEKRLLH